MGTQASRQCEPSGWDPGQESEKRAETWPRLWALGSIQLDGAMQAGPDAGPEGSWRLLVCRGERQRANWMRVQRVKCGQPGKHRGLWSPRRGARSMTKELRGSREEGTPVRRDPRDEHRSPGQEGAMALLVEEAAGKRSLLIRACLTHLGRFVFKQFSLS